MGDEESVEVRSIAQCRSAGSHKVLLLSSISRSIVWTVSYCIVNEPWKGPSSPLFYINLDADTTWLRKCTLLPFNVGLYNGTSPERGQVDFLQDFHGDPAELRLNRIAIDFDHWKEPVVNADGIEDMGSIDILRELNNVRELLLVVTQPSMALSPADVVFVQPTWTPYGLLPKMELRESIYTRGHKSKRPRSNTQWYDAARRFESIMTQLLIMD